MSRKCSCSQELGQQVKHTWENFFFSNFDNYSNKILLKLQSRLVKWLFLPKDLERDPISSNLQHLVPPFYTSYTTWYKQVVLNGTGEKLLLLRFLECQSPIKIIWLEQTFIVWIFLNRSGLSARIWIAQNNFSDPEFGIPGIVLFKLCHL